MALFGLSGCAYVTTAVKQSYYHAQLRRTPSPAIHKHLLDHPTCFVFGKVQLPAAPAPLAVLAISADPMNPAIVDVSHDVAAGSYYGLNLPPGRYCLVAARDRDGNGFYQRDESEAALSLVVSAPSDTGTKVRRGVDLHANASAPSSPTAFSVPVRLAPPRSESLVYPKGTLRSLSDPLFNKRMASLGLYEPAAFMEIAPLMFYALEEDLSYKVPVIFVHGIGGSPRDFETLVQRLDRRRYRPWFFYYPSGGSLDQLSHLFYEIFLSGNTIPRQETPIVIVAHSMGGLVVREALNRHQGTEREQIIGTLITLASPLGGHPAAARAAHAPVVIPSWRDLDPASTFIRDLHRKPLPAGSSYHLYHAFGYKRLLKLREPSDGVVPLASQLSPAAQREATVQHGFEVGHVEILEHAESVEHVVAAIEAVKSIYPPEHLAVLDEGGYALALEREFTPLESFLIRSMGRYLDALAWGQLQPFHPELKKFVDACRGRGHASTPAVSAWRKMERHFPERTAQTRS
jgi:pimeloyl-ACP methyl ester carboxylesterase